MGRTKQTARKSTGGRAPRKNKPEPAIRKRDRPEPAPPTIDFDREEGTIVLVRNLLDGHFKPTVAVLKEELAYFDRTEPAYLDVVGVLFACADENDTVDLLKWFAEVCPDHLASTQKVLFRGFEDEHEVTPAIALLSKAAYMSFDIVGGVKIPYTNKSLEWGLDHGVPLQDVADTVVGAMVDWSTQRGDVDTNKAVLNVLEGPPERIAEELPVFATLNKHAEKMPEGEDGKETVAAVIQRCKEVMAEYVQEMYPTEDEDESGEEDSS